MSKISFCFARHRKWWSFGSKFLMWADKSKFSHTSIYIDGFVYESVWPKARKIPFQEWDKTYSLEFWYPIFMDESKVDEIKRDLEELILLDRGYSIFQLAMIGIGLLNKGLDKLISKIHWNGKEHQICTELVAYVMTQHFRYEFGQDLDNVSLREAFQAAKEIYEKEGA